MRIEILGVTGPYSHLAGDNSGQLVEYLGGPAIDRNDLVTNLNLSAVGAGHPRDHALDVAAQRRHCLAYLKQPNHVMRSVSSAKALQRTAAIVVLLIL